MGPIAERFARDGQPRSSTGLRVGIGMCAASRDRDVRAIEREGARSGWGAPVRARRTLLSAVAWIALVAALAPAASCGPSPGQGKASSKPGRDAAITTEIDGDLDKAEARWRREIEKDRVQDEMDMRLLRDDPPHAPSSYGKVASDPVAEAAEAANADDPEATDGSADGFWTKAGKITFATLTVLVTLGAMAAPYLMMI